jgi:hypothetical protein
MRDVRPAASDKRTSMTSEAADIPSQPRLRSDRASIPDRPAREEPSRARPSTRRRLEIPPPASIASISLPIDARMYTVLGRAVRSSSGHVRSPDKFLRCSLLAGLSGASRAVPGQSRLGLDLPVF